MNAFVGIANPAVTGYALLGTFELGRRRHA